MDCLVYSNGQFLLFFSGAFIFSAAFAFGMAFGSNNEREAWNKIMREGKIVRTAVAIKMSKGIYEMKQDYDGEIYVEEVHTGRCIDMDELCAPGS